VHCWVCDHSARGLDSSARGAIIEYLSVIATEDFLDSTAIEVNISPNNRLSEAVKIKQKKLSSQQISSILSCSK
jgi:DNA primase catalytic subunit